LDLEFISENTRNVFNKLAEEKFLNDYTLVGGTALSLQLMHRLSEDLDFIYDGDVLKTNLIKKFIDKKFKGNYKLIKQDNDHQLDFIINDVKVTFFTNHAVMISFNLKDHSTKYKQTNIGTPEIIAVMKINALTQRNTIRDYYDLYFIAKNVIPVAKIFEKCRSLLPNISEITYSETIIFVDDIREKSISDHLKPKEHISKYEIADFFTAEIKNLYNIKN